MSLTGYQTGFASPKPSSPFIQIEDAISSISSAVDAVGALASKLCGDELSANAAMLKAAPPPGLFGTLDANATRLSEEVGRLRTYVERIESRLP